MNRWLRALKSMPGAPPVKARRPRAAGGVTKATAAESFVTLVVYGWHSVEPGRLAWVFPSFADALKAVRAMKNAVRWAILAGSRQDDDVDVEAARASGLILAEAI